MIAVGGGGGGGGGGGVGLASGTDVPDQGNDPHSRSCQQQQTQDHTDHRSSDHTAIATSYEGDGGSTAVIVASKLTCNTLAMDNNYSTTNNTHFSRFLVTRGYEANTKCH